MAKGDGGGSYLCGMKKKTSSKILGISSSASSTSMAGSVSSASALRRHRLALNNGGAEKQRLAYVSHGIKGDSSRSHAWRSAGGRNLSIRNAAAIRQCNQSISGAVEKRENILCWLAY